MTSNQKPSVLILFAAILFILACAPFAVGARPGSTRTKTPTALISMSSTSTLTATAVAPTITPNTTPALLAGATWGFSRIAFASNRSGSYQIYLMRPDGSKVVQLTQSTGDNTSPTWSPDAQHIAFVSSRDGSSQIYVMNPDGTQQTEISHGQGNNTMPLWLPDMRIAFVSDRKGLQRIFVMKADGGGLIPFSSSSIDATTNFLCLTSIGDALISFTTDQAGVRSVQFLDLKSGADSTPSLLNSNHDRSCPLVSNLVSDPWVVFQSNRDGNDEIYKFDTNNKSDTQLTVHSTASLGASMSSSSDWMVFASKRTGHWQIYVMGLTGNYQYNISNQAADDIQPAWEPY